MIDYYYYWPTPNGHKVTMFLEEAGLDYRIHPVDISAGDQFKPEFLVISPNNRVPAMIDMAPADGGETISVFESGAILIYLAEKTGHFLPKDVHARKTVLEWLFWQVGGLGPMAGQNHHFGLYALEKIPYAISRYVDETNRLYAVLNRRLANNPFVAERTTLLRIWLPIHGSCPGRASSKISMTSPSASLVRRGRRAPRHRTRVCEGRALQQPAIGDSGRKDQSCSVKVVTD